MFGRVAAFELRYQLRRPAFIISLAIFTVLAFLIATAIGLAPVKGKAPPIDEPRFLVLVFGAFSLFGMFVPLAILADVALRDTESKMDELIRATPAPVTSYVLAKFTGAFLIVCIAFAGVALGLAIGSRMWWIDPARIGPFQVSNYAKSLAIFVVPNLFITGALFFAVATATRSLFATYVGVLVFPVLWAVTFALAREPAYRDIAGLVEPSGLTAFVVSTAFKTIAERRAMAIPVESLLIWNRALWVGAGVVFVLLSIVLFRRRERAGTSLHARPAETSAGPVARRPILTQGGAGAWTQLCVRTGYEVRATLRGKVFLALSVLGAASTVGGLAMEGRHYGTPILPVTAVVAAQVAQSWVLLLIVVLLGAELVWRERQARMAEIIGATPTPNLVFFASKLAAMGLAVAAVLGVLMATGIVFQFAKGFARIDLGMYFVALFVLAGSSALMTGVLSLCIQTVANNKYVGILVTIGLLVAGGVAENFGPRLQLLSFAGHSEVPLTDMNGFGHFLNDALWFIAYWGCFTVLLGLAAYLLWVRGLAAPLAARLRGLRASITPSIATLAVLALLGAGATGNYIYWHLRTIDTDRADLEQWRVEYEKKHRQYESLPQPRIIDVEVAVDLKPETGGYSSRGRYLLQNRSNMPIDLVHVQFDFAADVHEVELMDADLTEKQTGINHFVFRPRVPFAVGETRTLTFATSAERAAFEGGNESSFVVQNGTFLDNSDLTPSIGVLRSLFLQDERRRRAHGLEPLDSAPAADDKLHYYRNEIRSDSDFVRFAITVSTSPDQTAIAPGYLQREWTENGRRYFRYEMDRPILNFWSVSSARYAIARDRWNDVDLAVYYHPPHDTNVPRMIEALKDSLAYYSANFGPYQHRQLRIVEFPGYADRAQSFPNTIPYSETFGFLSDNRDPASIDYVWQVTAHEVAHQWWAHQVIGANVVGAKFLSETLAEYSSLMVMEQRYGPDVMRRFFNYELLQYLLGRGAASDGERPLARVRSNQDYVAYHKGAIVMYALKDAIGEAAVNRALARFIRDYAYKSEPYPIAADLIRLLHAEAGPEYQQLVADLLEKIVLWDLAVTGSSATETTDGRWRVRVDVHAKKLESNSEGKEKAVPLDQPIDVGLFAADPNGSSFTAKDVIVLEKRQIKSGAQTVEFVVDRKPAYVGVNPYLKLIERETSDNIAALGGR